MDLLQKSAMEVCNVSEEVEPQSETLSWIAVSVLEDTKPLEVAYGVFDHDATRDQELVLLFLFGGERVVADARKYSAAR